MKSITNLDIFVAGLQMPVLVQSAVKTSRPSFELADSRDMNKIKMPKINSFTGEIVPNDKVCRTFNLGDRRLPVPPELLADFAPEKSTSIGFNRFVDAFTIPLFYIESFYNLIPQKGYEENYALVMEALNRQFVAGITQATFMNCSSVLCIIAYEDCIRMYKLRFDSQFLPVEPFVKPQINPDVPVFETLCETISNNIYIFDLSVFKDQFTEKFEQWLAAVSN